MKNKKNKLEQIAALLPEGLTEDTLEQVASLVNDTVNEQVEKKISVLTARVVGFMNTHMDKIKESALTQLAEENKDYKRAMLMDSIFEAVALEVKPSDEDNVISTLVTESTKIQGSNDTLISELNDTLEENTKLRKVLKVLNDKVKNLSEVSESKKLPFKSSEKAVKQAQDGKVTAQGADSLSKVDEGVSTVDNPFLSEEVMAHMPITG